MSIFKIAVIVVVIYIVIALIYKYLISIGKVKPNKISRLFYDDDEKFKKSWKKTKEKGILKHVIKITIITTVMMGVMSIFLLLNERSMYGEAQNQTLSTALLIGVILGVINSLTQWSTGNYRYNSLKEKSKVESEK